MKKQEHHFARDKVQQITPELAGEVIALYHNFSATYVKEVTGLPLHAIYKLLDESGVEVRSRGHRPIQRPRPEHIQEFIDKGRTQKQLAAIFNVNISTIKRWLQQIRAEQAAANQPNENE